MVSKVYLAGEVPPEGRYDWRTKIIPFLLEHKFAVLTPDPSCWGLIKLDDYYDQEKRFDFSRYEELASKFVGVVERDLNQVTRSDIVFAYIPVLTNRFGTTCEVYEAWKQKKTVWIITDPRKMDNAWAYTLATKVFRSFEEFMRWYMESGQDDVWQNR